MNMKHFDIEHLVKYCGMNRAELMLKTADEVHAIFIASWTPEFNEWYWDESRVEA